MILEEFTETSSQHISNNPKTNCDEQNKMVYFFTSFFKIQNGKSHVCLLVKWLG